MVAPRSRFEKVFGTPFSLDTADHAIFHAPYNKLVQKSFGRLMYNDYLRHPERHGDLGFEEFKDLPTEAQYADKAFLKHLVAISKANYDTMVQPSELITMQCGNSYCGSTYAGLLSLIANERENLVGKRSLLFSYGSGLAATMFSIKFNNSVEHIADTSDVIQRLNARTEVTPEEFTEILDVREQNYTKYEYKPTSDIASLVPGTYYVTEVDALERRFYARAFHTMAGQDTPLRPAVRPVPQRQRVVAGRVSGPQGLLARRALMGPLVGAIRRLGRR